MAIIQQLVKIAFLDWTPDNRLAVMLTTDEKIYTIRMTSFEYLDDEDDYVITTIYIDDLTDGVTFFKDVTTYGINNTAIDELVAAAIDYMMEIVHENETFTYAQIKGNTQYDKYWADLTNACNAIDNIRFATTLAIA